MLRRLQKQKVCYHDDMLLNPHPYLILHIYLFGLLRVLLFLFRWPIEGPWRRFDTFLLPSSDLARFISGYAVDGLHMLYSYIYYVHM